MILAAPRPNRPFADVPAALLESARREDLAVGSGNFYLPLLLARDRGSLAADLKSFPGDVAAHPGWFREQAPTESEYEALEAQVGRAAPDRSVFLLLDPPFWNSRLKRMMAARGDFSAETLRYGILVSSPPAGR